MTDGCSCADKMEQKSFPVQTLLCPVLQCTIDVSDVHEGATLPSAFALVLQQSMGGANTDID